MRGSITRLQKLEAKRAPKADASFYAFGMDEDDIAEQIAAATVSGILPRGQEPFGVLWRGPAPPPPSRWVCAGDLTKEEAEDAVATISALVGREPIPRGEFNDRFADEYFAIKELLLAQMQTPGAIPIRP